MLKVDELHPHAMDLAELAFRYQRKGDSANARKYFSEAYQLETQAAQVVPLAKESEPSRSILFRSAASLAYNAGDYETANRLVAQGLSGFPPPEIEEELKSLYDDINFMRHLSAKGVKLEERQYIMTLAGNAIAHGKVMFDVFLSRAEKVSTIFYRTVERLLNIPYRTSAGISRKLKEQYGLYIKAFEANSFAVTFQIGRPITQLAFFPDQEPKPEIDPTFVVDEIFRCFEILESEDPRALKEIIKDDLYYDNFIALTKQIAPDGDDVKLVGFTTIRDGKERPIALRKSRQQLRETLIKAQEPKEQIEEVVRKTYKGILSYANSPMRARRKYGTVKLTEKDNGAEHTIRVPIALMKDIVQPYYEESVSILVHEKEGKKYLEDVMPDT